MKRVAINRVMEVRWGISGTATIALKNMRSIISSSNGKLVAVASRKKERVGSFLSGLPISLSSVKAHEGYDKFVIDIDNTFDILYCPLPVSVKVDYVLKALTEGSLNVLVEKPVAKDLETAMTMLRAAEQNDRVFMDGTMFMHHERTHSWFAAIRERSSNHPGRLNISADFSFNGGADDSDFFTTNIRTQGGDPAGALGDLGHYCIRVALMAGAASSSPASSSSSGPTYTYNGFSFEWPKLQSVECKALDGEYTDLITGCLALVKFDRMTLRFTCSFKEALTQDVTIKYSSTSDAFGDMVIKMDDFVIPHCPEVAGYDLQHFPATDALVDFHRRVMRTNARVETRDCCQERCMVEKMGDLVLAKGDARTSEEKRFWRAVIYATQNVQDACERSYRNGGIAVSDLPSMDLPPL